jgi:phage-related protein
MRPVCFLGDSLKCLRDFPEDARHDAGYQLDKVQRGEQPDDFKPKPAIGKMVEEIRFSEDSGTFRVVYVQSDLRGPVRGCGVRAARIPEEDAGDFEAGY